MPDVPPDEDIAVPPIAAEFIRESRARFEKIMDWLAAHPHYGKVHRVKPQGYQNPNRVFRGRKPREPIPDKDAGD